MAKAPISVTVAFLALVFALSAACSGQKEVAVNLTGATAAFSRADLDTVIFIATYGDNAEKRVFPETCVNFPDAGCATGGTACGYEKATSEFRLSLEAIPDGSSVVLTVCGRDQAGTVIFQGDSAAFTNDSNLTEVSVNVTES